MGGDDPDAIDPEDDWYGEPELAEDEVGDADETVEDEPVSEGSEQGRPITPAEESAMRVVQE